jgi:CPA2 family monovalent cation:H+ antiporter-2
VTPEIPVLRELILLAGASLAVVLLFRRLRLPATVGFIVTGILVGPGGFALVRDPNLVRTLAEFGVVVLLFTVGLEFSLADLKRLGRRALVGGALQVLLTLAVVAGALVLAGRPPARAIFLGMLVSLSSTAVVLKLLTDRIELQSPHGRIATGVLLFQDLAAIPFLLLVAPLGRWARGEPFTAAELTAGLPGALLVVAAVALVLLLARRVLPWLLGRASRSGSREAFLFGILLVVLGSASLASRAGGSLAVGAFLAGLMLAGSELRDLIAADVLPLRDALASVFFIAVGMSFDPAVVLARPDLVAASTAGLVIVKLGVAFVALRLGGVPGRVSAAAALALAQIGEFSFVLAQAGRPLGLLGVGGSQAFFAGAVFSLLLTPFLVPRASGWALALDRALAGRRGRPGEGRAPGEGEAEEEEEAGAAAAPAGPRRPHENHVVIAGFGLNGQNVARVLRSARLPHLVVDLNPDAVAEGHRQGSPVLVGDIGNPLIQRQAGVPRAKVLVLALSDPTATRHACRVARSLSSDVFIVVRTRYVDEIDQLYAAGANQVIPEEFETSIEIFTSVMRELHVPTNIILAQIMLLRQERYSLLRGRRLQGAILEQLPTILLERTTDTFLLLQESPAVGRTPAELRLGAEGEARLVAVVRGGRPFTSFEDEFRLRVGDTLVVTGTHAEVDKVFERLRSPAEPGSVL